MECVRPSDAFFCNIGGEHHRPWVVTIIGRLSPLKSITEQAGYKVEGKAGKAWMDSRKIVFESGPFSTCNAKLLPGPRIGMNLNGGTLYK